MSLTGDIANLVGKADELIDTFKAKEAGIEQAVQAAVAAVPDMHKVFYVDPGAGSDAAKGDAAEPLLTLNKAVELTPVNGSATVYLLGDITLPPRRESVARKGIMVHGHRAAAGKALIKPTVYEHGATDGNIYAYLSGWNTGGLSSGLMFRRCDFEFPTYTGPFPAFGRYSSVLGNISGYEKTLSHFGISNSALTFPPADGFGYLATALSNALVFMANTIIDTNNNMSGHYIEGASTTNVSDNQQLLTNLETL